jgi:hypothetical protein
MSKQISKSKIESLHAAVVASLTARAQFAVDHAIPTQAVFFATQAKKFTTHCVQALAQNDVDVQALAVTLGNCDKSSGSAFLAKYAVEKVVKFGSALAQNSFSQLDRYSQSMLLNTNALTKLSAKGALVCLSSAIVYDEMETQQATRRYGNCTPGTASTQRSSSREAMRVLSIASTTKGKRDDVIEYADTMIARTVQALTAAVTQA